jgi:hypothetical protein
VYSSLLRAGEAGEDGEDGEGGEDDEKGENKERGEGGGVPARGVACFIGDVPAEGYAKGCVRLSPCRVIFTRAVVPDPTFAIVRMLIVYSSPSVVALIFALRALR